MSSQANAAGRQQYTIKQTVTIAISTPVNKATLADLRSDVLSTSTRDEIQIPDSEAWIVTDLFIAVAGDVANADADCYLQLKKNRRWDKGTVGPLTTMLISNQQRPRLRQGIGYEAGSILQVLAVNISVPAAARTNNFYMDITKFYR